jgi:hypothetical protein
VPQFCKGRKEHEFIQLSLTTFTNDSARYKNFETFRTLFRKTSKLLKLETPMHGTNESHEVTIGKVTKGKGNRSILNLYLDTSKDFLRKK